MGQPSVENGHRAELNQVSSVSGSWVMLELPHLGQVQGASLATTVSPQSSQYQAGIWWPHHSWRLMHQSRPPFIQLI